MHQKLSTKQIAIQVARGLRKKQTRAECKFWEAVRGRKLNGYKIQRQFPIFYEYLGRQRFFIADFYCCEKKLLIEIDGGIHESQEDYDEIRTEIMETQQNIKVIRFSNEEVLNDLQNVLNKLKTLIIEV